MLRKIALLLLVVHYGVAFGAAKPEKQIGDGQPSTQTSQTDKRGTKDSPLIVETRTTHSDSETAEEVEKEAEQKHVNRWNIGLTIVIAACAFLQVLAIAGQIVVYLKQTRLMGSTLEAIGRQADLMAIQVTEMKTQATHMERQITAQMDATNPLISVVPDNKIRFAIGYMFEWTPFNLGTTAGFIIETATHFEMYDSREDIPETPSYRNSSNPPSKPILPQKEGEGDGIGLNTRLSPESIDKRIEAWDGITLFAYGRIKYRDIYQRTHETRFGFIWFPDADKFDVGGPEQYNQYT